MDYFLVEWEGEGKYSSVSKNNIADGVLRGLDNEALLGRKLLIQWGRKEYLGILHQFGTKTDMQNEVKVWAEEAAAIKEKEIIETNEIVPPSQNNVSSMSIIPEAADSINVIKVNSIASVLENIPLPSPEIGSDGENPKKIGKVSKWKEIAKENELEVQRLKTKVAKWKNVAKNRKKEIKTLKKTIEIHNSDLMIEIGQNVHVSQSNINTLKNLSDGPNVFARNLMRILFQKDELEESSLFGVACSANKNLTAILPELDPVRRNAIIKYTLNTFGGTLKSENVRAKKNYMLREVKRSMSDFLREMRKKKASQQTFVQINEFFN